MSRKLLVALRHLKEPRGVINKEFGICHNICLLTNYDIPASVKMKSLFSKWPQYSGDIMYPVPATFRPHSEIAAGVAFRSSKRFMWCKWLPYGRKRWALVDFMIAELEKEYGS